jgi:glycine/D-amino acid oxidase-like deaminating enzyme
MEDALKLLKAAMGFFPPNIMAVREDGTETESGRKTEFHSCCRPQTPDDLPVIGRSYRYRNLWYNAGHGHIGWTRGAGSSKLLADLMNGKQPDIDPTPFLPSRFLPIYKKILISLGFY